MRRLPRWAPSAAVACAVVGLAAWSFWQRQQLLAASPFPLGVDGYFYPVELRGLLAHGALPYPASPLAFYLLAPLAAVTDPITGAKLGAALFGAAVAVPAYGVGARLGGGRGAGLVAAALATTSVGSAYLTIEFVKNSLGLTIALVALWLVLRALERAAPGRVLAALAGVAAAYTTHKMAAGLVVAVALPATLAAAFSGGRSGRRLGAVLAGLTVVAAAALVAGAAFPQRVLSAGDVRLVTGLFSATPRWRAPALAFPSGELALGHDALLGLVLGLGAVLAWPLRDRVAAVIPERWRTAAPLPAPSISAAAWPIVGLALVIGLPFLGVTDRDGLGFRLRIAAFVPAALTAAFVARAVLAQLVHRDVVLSTLALVLAVARQPGDRLPGAVTTHPALVTAAQALAGRLPTGAALIVPERHIAFMLAWYAGADVALRPDGIPRARRYRALPLHFIGDGSALDRALIAARAEPTLVPPLGLHPSHPNGLVIVAEPTWEWILARLPATERARLLSWPTI